jgi:hypothetical protein
MPTTSAARRSTTSAASMPTTSAAIGARYTASRQADAQCDRQYPESDRAG